MSRLLCTGALFFCLLADVPPARCQPQILLDGFEKLDGWEAIHSHGDAAAVSIAPDSGRTGKALRMDFSFLGFMGSVSIQKRFAAPLPRNYRLAFDIRGEAPVNNLVVRLKDSIDNVWWVNRTSFRVSRTWTTVGIRKYQIQYGWGPSMGGELRVLDRVEIMVDVVEGGSGSLWFDNFRLEPLDDLPSVLPGVKVSSSQGAGAPLVSADGRSLGAWHSADGAAEAWIVIDFGGRQTVGGLVIDWDPRSYAESFDVALSDDGTIWRRVCAVRNAAGKRSFIPLEEADGRYLRLAMAHSASGRGFRFNGMELRGPEFSFSPNEFLSAVAAMSPPGFYPRYFLNRQSYWTVAGVPGDAREALINEQGMVETDKLSFSLDPLLFVRDTLLTWNDVTLHQDLPQGYLPVPSVHWKRPGVPDLTITALAAGEAGRSVLYARYALVNGTGARSTGKLFIAVRPFQVNPPWQTFTIVGGVSRIDSIVCDKVIRVNGRKIIPLTTPDAAGAATFDQGHITEYLRDGVLPGGRTAFDPRGLASGALQYDFDLAPGESRDVILAVPFHGVSPGLTPGPDPRAADSTYVWEFNSTLARWKRLLDRADIRLPASAPPIAATIRSNLGYVLINSDSVATQPGSRSYERSWLRDGSLTCTAFLQMGLPEEVRAYLDWYSTFQFPDGRIPAVVDHRGPEPTPEHDSHGQFLYAILQYFRFTHDTTWLRGKWDAVVRTVRAIQALRALRKTDTYRNGTPLQQACYGLMPESISHEGYSWKPQHSYWDDFFVARGLKDAAAIAGLLGRSEEEKEFTAEHNDLRAALSSSLRRAMALKGISYVPGCVELGDFSGLSTTIALSPCDEADVIPAAALDSTFDTSYRQFLDRKSGRVRWDAYLPYEARFISAFVLLGRRDRAGEVLAALMQDRRPEGWNHWAEVVWNDRDAPRSIGDMPHSWAASDFIRSVRTMLVYERERDEALVVGAGISPAWLDDPEGVAVRNLPTYYGPISFTMRREGGVLAVELGDTLAVPPGKIVVALPPDRRAVSASGGTLTPDGAAVIVDALPAVLRISYH